jgi:hypothetical protein
MSTWRVRLRELGPHPEEVNHLLGDLLLEGRDLGLHLCQLRPILGGPVRDQTAKAQHPEMLGSS